MTTEMILGDIWYSILGFILFLAVALDGFDLGIGMLSLLTRNEEHLDLMMGSIGPVWHANLTWLVVLGGLFFGAFPLAYGVIFSALYIPLIVMLFGLIFRGVSFDFREEARHKSVWNLSFGLGSLAAALAQGFALGAFVSGFHLDGTRFAGSVWDWLNPLAALIALGVLSGYVLLGSTYLIMKTEGEVQQNSYRYAQAGAWSLLLLGIGVGLWALLKYPFLSQKWFVWPGFWLTTFPTGLAAVCFALLVVSLLKLQETTPFLLSLLIFLFSFFAMAASIHPYVIPPGIELKAAAAPTLTLAVMLIVVGLILPLMLLYNGYQYRVFWGKAGEGYGD